mgnify:CR=1 FL=1
MIGKLRLRFIRIVMESFLAVLILILVGVNCINRYNVYSSIDRRLDYLSDSAMGPPVGMMASTPQVIQGWVDMNTAGLMNEYSYFIFSGYMTGPILTHQLEMLSAATGEDAARLLQDLLSDNRDRGDLGQYRYYVAARDMPYKIVFLRCESEFDAIRSLFNTSVVVGLASFLVVLALVSLLSGRAIKPFQENEENQRRFISNAGHELKTPLGVIMSDLDMQVLESGQTEWLQNAQLQADHLALLIEQLTTYSLLTEKKQQTAPVPVDLSALSRSLLSEFRPLALAKSQTLEGELGEDIFVQGNEDALRTLLSVLLDNAVKYAPEGGRILLSLRREKKAVIQVRNTCPDAGSIDFSQLFERFYRSPEHRPEQNGHGLGLSIAHDIALMYGGTVRAEAAEDGDAVIFTAELPL